MKDVTASTFQVKLTIAVLVLMSLGLYAQAPVAPPAAQAPPIAQAPRPTPISPGGLEALKAMNDTLKPLQDDLVVLQKAVAGFQKDQQEMVNLTLSLVLNAECAKAGGVRCQYNTQGADPSKWTLTVAEPAKPAAEPPAKK